MIIEKEYRGTTIKMDTLGGEIFSWVKDGIDYLWGGDQQSWTGRSPHLFPCINVTATPKVKMKDQWFEMTKHGLVRLKPFEVYEEKEDEVTFVYESNEDSLSHYPYRFTFYVTHTLHENGFKTTYKVVNNDDEVMPYQIGGHPGFRVPLLENESFSDYHIEFNQPMDMRALAYEPGVPYALDNTFMVSHDETIIPLNYELFDNDALVFPNVTAHSLKVINQLGKGFSFSYPEFPVLALWTKPQAHAPYICLEPWFGFPAIEGDTEQFESKRLLEYLQPNTSKTYAYEMTVL